MADSKESGTAAVDEERRSFLSRASSVGMLGALVASYGTFAGFAGRFLFPADMAEEGWTFVTTLQDMNVGEAMQYKTSAGVPVTIKRHGNSDTAEDFIALGSTCPHLGCVVKWEPQNNRFFCPCHSGVFDPTGVATEGPPAKAHQKLPEFPLKVVKNLLYIQVSNTSIAMSGTEQEGIEMAGNAEHEGHDPCLFARAKGNRAEEEC